MEKQQIGTFTLSAPHTYKNEFPTASWYEMVEVQPGAYPIMGTLGKDGSIDDTSISICLPGTVTKSYFENRVFWASSAKVDENVGQQRNHYCNPYAHALAWEILKRGDVSRRFDYAGGKLELSDEFQAVRKVFTYNGEQHETAKIVNVNTKMVCGACDGEVIPTYERNRSDRLRCMDCGKIYDPSDFTPEEWETSFGVPHPWH